MTTEQALGGSVDMLSLLEEASTAPSILTILEPSGHQTKTTFTELWRLAAGAASRLREHVEPDTTVATILSSSLASLATAIGVLRGGWTLASLPQPARAMSLAEYMTQLQSLCVIANAEALVVDADIHGQLAAMSVPTISAQALQGAASSADLPHGGKLLQFSSGSTAQPKGIVLPLDRIGANVIAMIERLEPDPREVACTWLPLSHDMGLIGAFFTAWAAKADLFLIAPEVFVREPAIWMRACAESSATYTCGPNFGYAMAARAAAATGGGSLASLRTCIVGAEPISADTLRAFTRAMAPQGFRERSLMPAYGLAEASLCVSAVAVDEMWHTECLDYDMLGSGMRAPADANSTELVSVGRPLRDIKVKIANEERDVGEIMVAGPSLLARYVGRDVELVEDRWLPTGDLGYFSDDQLFITGRKDDLLFVAGRNLYASDLEMVASKHPAVRIGNCVAAARNGGGGYVMIAEHRHAACESEIRHAAGWIRQELGLRFGAVPADVIIVRPGALPKTPTGKIARRRTMGLYESGAFEQTRRSP